MSRSKTKGKESIKYSEATTIITDAGNLKALFQVYEKTKMYWRKVLSSRSTKSYVNWDEYREILSRFPLLRPKLSIPYRELKLYAML